MIKKHIQNLVEKWIKIFPKEAEIMKNITKEKREKYDSSFGDNKDVLEGPLYEIPETLLGMFNMLLTEEELNWLKSKEGGMWFAKTFNEIFGLRSRI